MSRVARYHADRTNQKLYFARLGYLQAEALCDNLQQAQAYKEAVVFHLQGAVFAFLQELVRYYRLTDIQPTLQSVEQKMAEKGQVSPEISILKQLSINGFLAELNHAYRMCQYSPEPNRPQAEEDTSSRLIIKVTQGPQSWLPDTTILIDWCQQLMHLINGFRDEMVEF